MKKVFHARPARPKIAAVILAAGQSRRMGSANKLLARLNGKSFIRCVAESASTASLEQIIVVSGYEPKQIEMELSGLNVTFAHNPNFAEGLSSSLRIGIEALGAKSDAAKSDAALILLGDMPFVTADIIDDIAAAYSRHQKKCIIIPCHKNKRGNPVLWPRRYFRELASLCGDQGARQLFNTHADAICEVELGEEVLIDIDTPGQAAALGAREEVDK